MQSEVNIKYVLGLEEKKDKTLQIIQIAIPQSSVIIEELEAMQENPNRNLYDMSSYFYSHVNPIKNCYHYCFPEEYHYSYLNEKVTPVPKEISYWEYKEIDDERRKKWRSSQSRKKDIQQSEIEKRWNEYVHKLEYHDKIKYFSLAKKYILCQNLYTAMQEAKNNPDIKIYSRDIVGRKHFLYDINDDVKVDVYTNFGYGSASHFFLTIKYKDIVLIPYSDLVHFYYANMKSLVANTRAYSCFRDSWAGLMDYLSKFVNNSRRDPENFVRNYVLNEIEEMMKVLRAILKNPSEILEHMQVDNGENIRLSVVRAFDRNEFVIFEAMPKELTTVFKIEKISGALHFVENLKSLKDICPEVDSVIEEIIELNKSIAPEIPTVLESIDNSIKPLQEEYDALDKEFNKKYAEQERLEKMLERKLSYCRTFGAQKKCKETFIKQTPRYKAVAEEISELSKVMGPLCQGIERRKRLRRRIESVQPDIYRFL